MRTMKTPFHLFYLILICFGVSLYGQNSATLQSMDEVLKDVDKLIEGFDRGPVTASPAPIAQPPPSSYPLGDAPQASPPSQPVVDDAGSFRYENALKPPNLISDTDPVDPIVVGAGSQSFSTGSRIATSIGEDYPVFRFLTKRSQHRAPIRALILLGSVALVLVLTYSFETVLVYIEFITLIFTFMTASGVFVLRMRAVKEENTFRMPFFPITPCIYLGITSWIIWHVLTERPIEALSGLGTLAIGVVVYAFCHEKK